MFPDHNQPIDLKSTLIDLASYRVPQRLVSGIDPIVVHVAYTLDNLVYEKGRMIEVDEATYADCKKNRPNDLVNKFGLAYRAGMPLLLHKRLADVIIDAAIDLHQRFGYITVVMDGLRTYDSGLLMERHRPDLVELGLLAKAGTSAHNRALAVDSKLFEKKSHADIHARAQAKTALFENRSASVRSSTCAVEAQKSLFAASPSSELVEADEHGHLDDVDMKTNSRFYSGPMSDIARRNRLERIRAWQRASVRNRLPMANLLAEFWDDRVPGSPADLWRVLACRCLCVGVDGNPATNPLMMELKNALNVLPLTNRQTYAEKAHAIFSDGWDKILSGDKRGELEKLLGHGGGSPPPLSDFIFHEWLETIHDHHLRQAGFSAQSAY